MIIRNLILGLLGLLPFDTVLNLPASIVNIFSWIYFANYYLPMDSFVLYLAIILATWVVCAIISAILQLF